MVERGAYPKIRSGWDMKSVIRSSMLRGSRTNVGKVTFERSMPTLRIGKEITPQLAKKSERQKCSKQAAYLSCEIKDKIMDPSFSSLESTESSWSASCVE